MSVHRAARQWRWSRTGSIVAGACALVTVLAVGGWSLTSGPGGRGPQGSRVPASPLAPRFPNQPDASPSASATASATASTSPTPTRSASPSATRASSAPPPPAPGGQTQRYYVTLYAARDNTPSGSRAIAYPTMHSQAGGTGTYGDPITFATSRAELAVGTIIYYPYLKRYFVMEDDCTDCDADWTGRGPNGGPGYGHIDLWAGAYTDSGVTACENSLTQDGQVAVIVNPSAGLTVDPVPLYDGRTCYRPGG